MIAYDKRGAVFALVDEAEILAHDGDSEAPLWRAKLDGPIVAVSAGSDEIVAVAETGTVRWFGARTGDVRRTEQIAGRPRAAVVDAAGQRVVAATDAEIVALEGGASKRLADHGARALAMRPDGTVLAATGGDLVTLGADGARTAAPFAPGPPIAVAWHPEGFWVAGTAGKLYRWDGGDPVHITNLPKGAALDAVACCARAIALVWDRTTVVSMAWPSKETLGSLRYVDRKVTGVDFGPWPWLGVALDGGDGNKHNLDEPEQLHRSDTHPGREHRRWLVAVGGGPRSQAKAEPSSPRPAAAAAAPSASGRIVGLLVAIAVGIAVYYLMRR
jgi:hypothetical protein